MRPLPKTCDSLALHAKGKLAVVIKLRSLRWGDYPGGPSVLTRVLLSERGRESANTLILAQEDPFWTSDLQICEIIYLHCVRSLSVWQSLRAIAGNYCWQPHCPEEEGHGQEPQGEVVSCGRHGRPGRQEVALGQLHAGPSQAATMPDQPVWRELQAKSRLTGPLPTCGQQQGGPEHPQ